MEAIKSIGKGIELNEKFPYNLGKKDSWRNPPLPPFNRIARHPIADLQHLPLEGGQPVGLYAQVEIDAFSFTRHRDREIWKARRSTPECKKTMD